MDYDYATATSKGPLSCAGMTPAVLYYSSTPSEQFPLVAAGARTHMAGPVYRSSGKGALALPSVFQDKLLHWDWSRSLMFATPVADDGSLDIASLTPWSVAVPNTFVSAGAAVPAGGPSAPIEVVVGPDGALYVAEYGSGYYQNTNSAISRITCFQCTPSPDDYSGAPVDPDAGVEEDAGDCTTCNGTAPRPRAAAPGGALAATGGPLGLALLGLAAVGGAVVLRRHVVRPARDAGL
jgi:hypothetical protein